MDVSSQSSEITNENASSASQKSITEMETNEEEDRELAQLVDAEEFISQKGIRMLEYEKQMFLDVLHSDALVVCAKYVPVNDKNARK